MSGFSRICGDGISIAEDGAAATRTDKNQSCVVFSDAPLSSGETFTVRVTNVGDRTEKTASLYLGLTEQAPDEWRERGQTSLLHMKKTWCICTDVGFTCMHGRGAGYCDTWRERWGRKHLLSPGGMLSVSLSEHRALSVIYNNTEIGNLFTGLPEDPLWVVIEVLVQELQVTQLGTEWHCSPGSMCAQFVSDVRLEGEPSDVKRITIENISPANLPEMSLGSYISECAGISGEVPKEFLKLSIPHETPNLGEELLGVAFAENKWSVLTEVTFQKEPERAEINISQVSEIQTAYAVISRVKEERCVIDANTKATLTSGGFPGLQFNIPERSFRPKTNVSMKVENAAMTKMAETSPDVSQTSPMVTIQTDRKSNRPLNINIPLGKPISADGKILPLTQKDGGKWEVSGTIKDITEDNTVEIQMENLIQKMRILALEMAANYQEVEAVAAAESIDEELHTYYATIIVKQHVEDESNIMITCCKTDQVEDKLQEIKSKGFTIGPPAERTREFQVKDNQKIQLTFSDESSMKFLGRKTKTLLFSKGVSQQPLNTGIVGLQTAEARHKGLLCATPIQDTETKDEDISLILYMNATSNFGGNAAHGQSAFETEEEKAAWLAEHNICNIVKKNAEKIKYLACMKEKWKSVGRSLGLESAELMEIEYKPHITLSECVYKMIETWIVTFGKDATVQKLIEALETEKIGLAVDLIKDL